MINVKIICSGGTKNVGGYLRYWLDSYMSKERSVKINAFLRYINDNSISDELKKLLEDQDICFIYDILRMPFSLTDTQPIPKMFRSRWYHVSSR